MAKQIKINIKNTQLAKVLSMGNKPAAQKKAAAPKKAAPQKAAAKIVETKYAASEETPKKPRARILPPAPVVAPLPKVEEEKSKRKVKKTTLPETEEITPPAQVPPPVVEEIAAPPPPPVVPVKRHIDLEKLYPKKEKPMPPKPLVPIIEEVIPLKVPVEAPIVEKKVVVEETEEEEAKIVKKHVSLKPQKKLEQKPTFDTRYRLGLKTDEDSEAVWRKRRFGHKKHRVTPEEEIIRPKQLKIRLPITVKDLSSEMKLKASQIISKFFLQGMVVTLNDVLDDETIVQVIGHDFDCKIDIDTSEEKRLQITNKTIDEEIAETPASELQPRPPVITFMGHVDHGKTSLIDAIRKSNIAAGEAGAITQHIGAFSAKTATGSITILDTPGHEAFDEMRQRGALATDIVILVVAGDEGMKEQTIEALKIAKTAHVPIIVAINKSDKPGFDAEKVYRQLSDHELLPEAWGGTTITVNCSAMTQDGIKGLLEMIALQSEILELKGNPHTRARGTILESQMHKGLGAIATVLIQNGTLKLGDHIVFGSNWGRIKTMQDQYNQFITEAGPSTAVKVTGLSDMADAGCEFIVIANEKEAKTLAHDRKEIEKTSLMQRPKSAGLETLLSEKKETEEKLFLPLILRCDVQGSLEALQASLKKIHSKKVGINFVSIGVGEISESDIELAAASKATIIGFHTGIESHAEMLIRQLKTDIHLHTIIYHAIDDVKELMKKLLPKIPEEKDTGTAEVIALFKSSQLGLISGCKVTKGLIKRDHRARQIRKDKVIWTGKIGSLKRVKEDVKEVQKGVECGILLDGTSDVEIGDIFQAYEITYHEQEI